MTNRAGNRTANPNAPLDPSDISDWFWSVIENANQDRESLRLSLEVMPDDDVIRFAMEFKEAAGYLGSHQYVEYLESRSEDNIYDTTCWIVSQGKERYLYVWHNPEAIATCEAEENDEEAQNFVKHMLDSVAEEVLTERLKHRGSQGAHSHLEGYDIVLQLFDDFDRSPYSHLQEYLDTHRGHLLRTAISIAEREHS
ncbi:MAG TPA: DUF4240 domain-containing protein [Chloroflexota bacterium]|nr:DUF4240 domain-containing protein [Chloroflexota bacterium]